MSESMQIVFVAVISVIAIVFVAMNASATRWAGYAGKGRDDSQKS